MRESTHSSVEPRSVFATWGPRILAPIFLIACAVAVLTVVNANESDEPARGQQAGEERGGNQGSGNGGESGGDEGGEEVQETYTVQSGDVFSAIAEENNVSTQKLEQLNPDIDPAALQPGQVLKLR